MATASPNGRTPEAVRREIEVERHELETAVEQLRDGLGAPTAASSAASCPSSPPARSVQGFFLAGGVGATMRFLARKGRER